LPVLNTMAFLIMPASALAKDTLEPVFITASRIEHETRESPSHTTIITADEIKKSTARTVQELLSLQAGIHTRNLYGNNAARSSIDIRGFGATASENTLILLNGRRVNDIDSSPVDLSSISLQNIERVEIVRGGGSVLYGDGAVGGSINIITRQHGKAGTTGYAQLTLGSFDSHEINAGLSHVEGDLSVNVSAQSLASDGYRIHNQHRQKNFQADLRHLLKNGELFARFGAGEMDLELPGERTVNPNTGLDQLNDDRRGSSKLGDFTDRKNHFLTLGTTRYLNDKAELVVDFGYRNKNDTYVDAFNYLDTEIFTWSFTPRVKIQNQWLGMPGTFTAGLDYYDSQYDSLRSTSPATASQPFRILDLNQKNSALYAKQVIKPGKQLRYNMGLRIQHVKIEAIDMFDSTAPGGFGSQAPAGNKSNTEHGAELGVSYNITNATTVYAGYNRAFRIATVDETLVTFPGGMFAFLRPQTSDNLDVGLKFKTNKLDLQSGIYYMRLKNEIHFNPVTFTNINLDPTRRFGLEISSQYQLSRNFKINANLAFSRSEFRQGSFAGNDVPLAPEKTAAVSALWNIKPDVLLSSTLNYVGKKRFDNDQTNTFSRIPSYKTVDIKLTGKLSDWNISAQVKNLFNEKYFEYGVISTFTPGLYNAYPLPEREYSVSLERKF